MNVICPDCGSEFELGMSEESGMEDQNGWKGIRPKFWEPREEVGGKKAQDLTWPIPHKKHDRVRVPSEKGREIGTIQKVYLDESLDVSFPSMGKETLFVDSKSDTEVQRVGLKKGDRFSNGVVVQAIHINKDVGVYAATIIHDNGVKEVVTLENVDEIGG